MSTPPRNLPAMVWARVLADGARPILREKQRGIWCAVSAAELGGRMRAIGQGLRATGFEPGEVACVLAATRPEWVYADLGIQGAGGIAAGIHPGADAELLAATVRDCSARVLFVENEEQLDKALHARAACPALERIVILDMKGLRDLADPMCESLEAFIRRGEAHDAREGRAWENGLAEIRPDQPAMLLYTAGTTGAPKGVVLSHRAVLAQIERAAELFGLRAGDERLAFMPMGHVIERVLGLHLSLHAGVIGNYVESADTVAENLREVRPSVLAAAPHVWERFHARVAVATGEATAIQRGLFAWAMAAGRRRANRRLTGRAVPPWTALEAGLLRRLVLGNAHRDLGLDRLRVALIGGAPVSASLIAWFRAFGIDLIEIYGQTECAGLAAAMPAAAPRADAVGKPVPSTEVAIAPDGEIKLRGPHLFTGYWNQPDETARTLDADGWLRTGDIGAMSDGYLRVTGRLRDVSARHAVSTAAMEKELKASPFIADALVFGEERAFLSCVVMIDHDAVERWARAGNIAFSSFAGLARAEPVRARIGEEIARAAERLGSPGCIRAFRLIDRKLEPDDAELTPVMKLRRGVVAEKYGALIEEMYSGA